ncbi:hypothetical protein [Varibaculum cambriense]|uniref:Uncharacterized protein n=1 Tax=Varibaculum cambriense TaxID=184870 RepID=A0ABX4URT5_9ACTO|nr:hypothetical protein [Varibaculum cambriense]PMB89258.1 hypothetical protein CJ240_05690 [Varibaculum cambriense]
MLDTTQKRAIDDLRDKANNLSLAFAELNGWIEDYAQACEDFNRQAKESSKKMTQQKKLLNNLLECLSSITVYQREIIYCTQDAECTSETLDSNLADISPAVSAGQEYPLPVGAEQRVNLLEAAYKLEDLARNHRKAVQQLDAIMTQIEKIRNHKSRKNK